MKFKASALAVTAIAAIGLASSAFAENNSEPTSYDKLGFTTNLTFSANASGTSNGSWNATPVVTDSKIEIDSDADAPLRFTPAPANANANAVNDATELKFKVEASVVPNSVALAIDTDAQCGFAIKDTGNETQIMVFNGTEWKDASGVTVPTAGSEFDLMVKLDYRSNPGKVQYLVGGTALTVDSSTWLSLPENKTNVSGIDFVGNGLLESLRGDVLQIASEVIQINPTGSKDVEVKFSEEQLNALRDAVAGGTTDAVIEKLNSQTVQANNQKPFDNYIMYGKIKDEDISASTVPVVKADPAAAPQTANNVVVKVPALSVQFVEGVTVTHQLRGSNDCSSWTNVGNAITSTKEKPNPSFEIGAGTGYKFYQVVTTVSTTGVAK